MSGSPTLGRCTVVVEEQAMEARLWAKAKTPAGPGWMAGAVLDLKGSWEAFSCGLGAGRAANGCPNGRARIQPSCTKPQICINSVSLGVPHFGAHGRGIEGLFDFHLL